MFRIFGFEIHYAFIVLGLILGMTYGVLAAGLVLVYRANRVINFAHGQVGAVGAAILFALVTKAHVFYWLAFPVAIGVAALAGAGTELAVIRRLRSAPRVMSVIGTLGVAQLLYTLAAVISIGYTAGLVFPQPVGLPTFFVGPLLMTPAYTAMLIVTPLVVAGLAAFLRFSRYGVAIRAAADNAEAATMAGVSPARMSMMAWSIAGALAGYTALLVLPAVAQASSDTFGPGLVVRALAAAVIARMESIWVALLAGIGIGVLEQELLLNTHAEAASDALLFVIILVGLLLQRQRGTRVGERGSWVAVAAWRPLPETYRRVWLIRNLGRMLAAVAVMVMALLPLLVQVGTTANLVLLLGFGMVAMSVSVITGLSGQLSLGQFAFAGVGAAAAYAVATHTDNYVLAFLCAGATAAAVSVIVGIPALRIRGLMLAAVTLAGAFAAETWLFQQPWVFGGGVSPPTIFVGSHALLDERSFYFWALAWLLVAIWLAHNVRSSGLGRNLIGVRDNEDTARSFTVPVTRRKLQAFALAGFIAGIGGAVVGWSLNTMSSQTFTATDSIDAMASGVIGGLQLLSGPLLGALYIRGLPTFLPIDSLAAAASALGWLLLILYFPGGIAAMVQPLRLRLVDFIARRAGIDPALAWSAAATDTVATPLRLGDEDVVPLPAPHAPAEPAPLLDVRDVRKSFGGVVAVDGVSLTVCAGETLGLIGPNGAGKTTLFELISGFTKPDGGSIAYEGRQLTRTMPFLGRSLLRAVSPERRGRLGLVRSFQDAVLFPTMTVLETVKLALERAMPSGLVRSVVGDGFTERERRARAEELVTFMGLDVYRHKQVRELSTGTRRITELCCLIALQPRLLLLDEPSSGIAQRETEALGSLLRRVAHHLDATMIIIEHDMPLIMGMSDRIIAMEMGRVIAEGPPAKVRSDPRVIEAYLGGDAAAIARSGMVPA